MWYCVDEHPDHVYLAVIFCTHLQDLRSAARKRLFACGSMVLAIVSVFHFCALRAQKRNTKEGEVPLRKIKSGLLRKSCQSPNIKHCYLTTQRSVPHGTASHSRRQAGSHHAVPGLANLGSARDRRGNECGTQRALGRLPGAWPACRSIRGR